VARYKAGIVRHVVFRDDCYHDHGNGNDDISHGLGFVDDRILVFLSGFRIKALYEYFQGAFCYLG
jgi:hypothetical protein